MQVAWLSAFHQVRLEKEEEEDVDENGAGKERE